MSAAHDHAGGREIDARLALTYVFADSRWPSKLFIGALFALGPVVVVGVFFLIGSLVEIASRVADGDDRPLPEWRGSLRSYFSQGFPVAWGLLVWMLPFAAVWAGSGVLLATVAPDLGENLATQIVFGIVMMVAANLYAAVIVPSVVVRYAAERRFGSMFELGEIFGSVRRIGTGFVPVWIVHLAILALTWVTIWTIVAIVFTIAYAAMVCGHVYGQAARVGEGQPAS